ncbi:mCG146191, partial [Mus musculus]
QLNQINCDTFKSIKIATSLPKKKAGALFSRKDTKSSPGDQETNIHSMPVHPPAPPPFSSMLPSPPGKKKGLKISAP